MYEQGTGWGNALEGSAYARVLVPILFGENATWKSARDQEKLYKERS